MIETTFTPLQSLSGGVLIGLAAVLLMAGIGRIMGATGILSGFLQPTNRSDWGWRAAILLGMVSGPMGMKLAIGHFPTIVTPSSSLMLIIGGFLVGIGVTFGSGCTSGHGVCGLARLSSRSIVATLTFMVTTAITVYVIRHVIGG